MTERDNAARGGNLDHGWDGGHNDARLDAPSYHRNHRSIVDVLMQHLTPQTGHGLEIGSGSGQHVTGFTQVFPQIVWHPSDPDVRHRESIAAWGAASEVENIRSPIDLDVSQADWSLPFEINGAETLDAIVCINVLHIAPWSVSQGLLAGAGRHLAVGGMLFIYGPFKQNGSHTAPSNAAFDESLRGREPAWGIRDIEGLDALAVESGLALLQTHPMPSNNFTLVFSRTTA